MASLNIAGRSCQPELYSDIAARSCGMLCVDSAPMAEPHALRDGLQLAGDMACNSIVVQSPGGCGDHAIRQFNRPNSSSL